MKAKWNKLFKKTTIFIIPTIVMMGACTGTGGTRTSEQEEVVINRVNRDIKIGFQGILLGTPNKDIPTLFDRLTNVKQSDIPYRFKQNQSGSNTSFYANEYEQIIATFESAIIDSTETSHNGYGMLLADGDSITQIVFSIEETDDPLGVYNRLLPLFVNQYGNPDEQYESEIKSYLQNIGVIWKFDNNQRICLNRCIYPGGAQLIEFERMFKNCQRVEVIYQDINALERKEAKEREEEQARIDAENAEREKNREQRGNQQL